MKQKKSQSRALSSKKQKKESSVLNPIYSGITHFGVFDSMHLRLPSKVARKAKQIKPKLQGGLTKHEQNQHMI
jgi:hypothetical protein